MAIAFEKYATPDDYRNGKLNVAAKLRRREKLRHGNLRKRKSRKASATAHRKSGTQDAGFTERTIAPVLGAEAQGQDNAGP
jgi:hypothetical protein